MIRKMLLGIGIAGLLAAGVSTPAQATTVAGAAVFVGNATVGSGAYTGAVGSGLCLPAQVNLGGCVQTPAAPAAQGWSFTAGGTNCVAVGVFGSSGPAAGTCSLDMDGTVGPNLAPLSIGPSCGMSGGNSAAEPTSGATPDVFLGKDATVGWITSAGGTLVIDGSLTDSGHGHLFAGLVQARPLTPGACVSAPATDFTIAGVVVAAAA